MKVILLIMIGLSVFLSAAFTKSDNIVTDSITHLQWQDDAIGSTMRWQSAITYCADLTLDSLDDWRLPNINELKSIIDRDKYSPAIVTGFENTSSNDYWSSTTFKSGSGSAWVVDFRNGYVSYDDKRYTNFARCVRAGE